jgi:hypothetical protein
MLEIKRKAVKFVVIGLCITTFMCVNRLPKKTRREHRKMLKGEVKQLIEVVNGVS